MTIRENVIIVLQNWLLIQLILFQKLDLLLHNQVVKHVFVRLKLGFLKIILQLEKLEWIQVGCVLCVLTLLGEVIIEGLVHVIVYCFTCDLEELRAELRGIAFAHRRDLSEFTAKIHNYSIIFHVGIKMETRLLYKGYTLYIVLFKAVFCNNPSNLNLLR